MVSSISDTTFNSKDKISAAATIALTARIHNLYLIAVHNVLRVIGNT